ncbi:hypothetical protein AB0E75_03145 [Streptomyces griseoviridis]|uniref:hypothetical protein n=1 Tax=Streptomyces griseoviridis TaxID=45398 RepID=UPI00167330D5|nr:hypothetical protein [Streptomyces niveoruber]
MAEATVAALVRRGRDVAARWGALGVVTRDAVGTVRLAPVVFAPVTASIGARFGDLPQRPYDLPGVLLTAALWLPPAVRRRWPGACLVLVVPAFGARELIASRRCWRASGCTPPCTPRAPVAAASARFVTAPAIGAPAVNTAVAAGVTSHRPASGTERSARPGVAAARRQPSPTRPRYATGTAAPEAPLQPT